MLFSLVFGGVFLLTGAIPLFIAIRTFRKEREIARRWPRAPGKITSSHVESRKSTSRDKNGFTSTSTVYDPIVKYTYTVDGQELSGDRIAREVASSSTKPDISRWPAGQDVMVLHDPKDPKIAFLETRLNVGAVILAVMGSVFAFVGILVPLLVTFAGGSP